MDQRGKYRCYEYRDVCTDVIDRPPQCSGNSSINNQLPFTTFFFIPIFLIELKKIDNKLDFLFKSKIIQWINWYYQTLKSSRPN